MAEIVITCSECRLGVRVTSKGEELLNARWTCNHSQNPLNCPMLQPALSVGRRAVQAPVRSPYTAPPHLHGSSASQRAPVSVRRIDAAARVRGWAVRSIAGLLSPHLYELCIGCRNRRAFLAKDVCCSQFGKERPAGGNDQSTQKQKRNRFSTI